ncbi:MAG: dephospho-CoA kinase [Bacteroidales bacterium]|nr:dephospho-CoA kinase [Bacteroidales bacterium]
MITVGLTGGIGSGKTFIAEVFQQLDVPVFFADEIAKNLYNRDDIKSQISAFFGDNIYMSNGIDKTKLANMIFNDQAKLDTINHIIHPAVEKEFQEWTDSMSSNPLVIKESALLFETDNYKNLDATILVVAPIKLRIKRIMERDSSDEQQVSQRMNMQWKDEQKTPLADYIINNDEQNLIVPEVIKIYNQLTKEE